MAITAGTHKKEKALGPRFYAIENERVTLFKVF
jgi:hypothetical protein